VPDYADPRPVKAQITDDLRQQVASGAYAPGDRLPPLRDLAAGYGVAVETVRAALDELRREGVVQSRSTRGTYVLRTPSSGTPPSEYGIVMGRIDDLAEEVRRLRAEVAELRQAREA